MCTIEIVVYIYISVSLSLALTAFGLPWISSLFHCVISSILFFSLYLYDYGYVCAMVSYQPIASSSHTERYISRFEFHAKYRYVQRIAQETNDNEQNALSMRSVHTVSHSNLHSVCIFHGAIKSLILIKIKTKTQYSNDGTHTHTPEQAGNEEQTKCVFKPKPIKMIERFHERARFVCVRVFEWLCWFSSGISFKSARLRVALFYNLYTTYTFLLHSFSSIRAVIYFLFCANGQCTLTLSCNSK